MINSPALPVVSGGVGPTVITSGLAAKRAIIATNIAGTLVIEISGDNVNFAKFKRSCPMSRHSRRLASGLVTVLGLALGSCDRNRLLTTPPTGPTPPAPTAPQPSSSLFTLSGVVFDHTSAGPRPRAAVPLLVRSRGLPGGQVTSDVNGRYEISGVPSGAVTIGPWIEADYRAPCPPGTDVLKGNATFDVHVVSTTLLSGAGAPASMPKTDLWISGVVFERTSEGVRPIAGATVDLANDDSERRVISTTLTDAAGRYLLCTAPPGTGSDQTMWVLVRREAYRPGSRSVFGGWDYDGADVELIRN